LLWRRRQDSRRQRRLSGSKPGSPDGKLLIVLVDVYVKTTFVYAVEIFS
jgi:hypothetical protein